MDRKLHQGESVEDMINASRGGDMNVQMPDSPSMDDPMFIYIGKPTLELIIEHNIQAVRENLARGEIGQTPNDLAANEALIADRERFLEWVRKNPNVNIFVGLFPFSEYPDTEE